MRAYPAHNVEPCSLSEHPMVEFLRSGAIILMGLVVIGAGVVVVFYG